MNDQVKLLLSEAKQALIAKKYDLAINKCRLAIAINPGAIEAYTVAGHACMITERYTDAEKLFRDAVKADKENGELHFLLGSCLLTQHRIQETLTCYAQAEKLGCSDESRKKIYYVMGVINQHTHKEKDALINYEKVEQMEGISEDYPEIVLNRVQIYVSSGDWDKAENCAMELKLLLPGEFKSYQLLLQILLQQKKVEKAMETLTEAECYCPYTPENRIEFAFDHALIHCFLADQEPDNKEKHFADALVWLDKLDAMDNLPADVRTEVLLTRTEIFLKLGRKQEAIAQAQVIAGYTDPALTEYIEKARFLLVDCCKQADALDKMIYYAELLKSSNNLLYSHHGYYSEFWAVNQKAKKDPTLVKKAEDLYDRAIARYKKAVVDNPGDFLAHVYRIQTYAENGRFDQAEKLCDILPEDARQKLMAHIESCRRNMN